MFMFLIEVTFMQVVHYCTISCKRLSPQEFPDCFIPPTLETPYIQYYVDDPPDLDKCINIHPTHLIYMQH